MGGKDYFVLGCKLFGVYCFAQAVPGVLGIFSSIAMVHSSMAQIGGTAVLAMFVGMLTPVIYLGCAVYLVLKGEALYEFAYPGGVADITAAEGKFRLYLKMLGIYLVVNYIPDFMKVVSALILAVGNPVYMALENSRRSFMLTNLASSLFGVIFGAYLVKDGRWVAELSFSSWKK